MNNDLNEKLTGIVRTIDASVQVEGYKSRQFKLVMDFGNCTMEDVLQLAMTNRRITWANSNRSKGDEHMASLPATVNIAINPPGVRGPVDVEAGFMAKMAGASLEDMNEAIKKIEAMKAAKKPKTILRKNEVA